MENREYYSKWERKSPTQQRMASGNNKKASLHGAKSRPLTLRSQHGKVRDFGYGSQPALPEIFTKKESACSSRCKHLPRAKQIDVKEINSTSEPSPDVIQMLEFQIKARRKCILECKKQILNLIQDNMKLKEEIEGTDSRTHGDVNQMLQKYHKLEGAIGTITREHAKQKLITHGEHGVVKKSTEDGLAVLERELGMVEKAVFQQQKNLKTLMNYKDKEYPEKVRRIKNLKKELEILQDLKVTEMTEIKRVVDIEKNKYIGSAMDTERLLLEDIRSEVFDGMNKEVKEMAIQNLQFRKEIEIHLKEKEKLLEENEVLEEKIRNILLQDKPIMQKKIFPGFFIDDEKCSPDTEVVLRIPKKDYVPI